MRATVFSVAVTTGLAPGQFPVQGLLGVKLPAHISMAVETAAGHGLPAPRCYVAGGTVTANLGMGSNAAKRTSAAIVGIELAGTKNPSSPQDQRADNQNHREHGSDFSQANLQHASHGTPITAAAKKSKVPPRCG
jgi:hypothetical protein